MSITSEFARLQTAKDNMKSAIIDMGGTISTDNFSYYDEAIRSIPKSGNYVWEVYDGNIEVASESYTVNVGELPGVASDWICALTTVINYKMGKFYFGSKSMSIQNGVFECTEAILNSTAPMGYCLIKKDGTMMAMGNNNVWSCKDAGGNSTGFVSGDSATAYASGWNSAEGKYYRPLFDETYSQLQELPIKINNTTTEISLAGLVGGYGFNDITITQGCHIATGTVGVTTSSPSSAGNLEITFANPKFQPTGFAMFINGAGSTNSVAVVYAMSGTTATYVRTTSGTATSSAGTKTVTYGEGLISVPQFNSTYNFKVGTWTWIAWKK